MITELSKKEQFNYILFVNYFNWKSTANISN